MAVVLLFLRGKNLRGHGWDAHTCVQNQKDRDLERSNRLISLKALRATSSIHPARPDSIVEATNEDCREGGLANAGTCLTAP
jgi:hypothetical protein